VCEQKSWVDARVGNGTGSNTGDEASSSPASVGLLTRRNVYAATSSTVQGARVLWVEVAPPTRQTNVRSEAGADAGEGPPELPVVLGCCSSPADRNDRVSRGTSLFVCSGWVGSTIERDLVAQLLDTAGLRAGRRCRTVAILIGSGIDGA